jgi:hypothetical protein
MQSKLSFGAKDPLSVAFHEYLLRTDAPEKQRKEFFVFRSIGREQGRSDIICHHREEFESAHGGVPVAEIEALARY